MRLDKYLKVSRLIKRRSVAKEVSDAGNIDVNGRKAKSSTKLSVGDTLDIRHGERSLRVKVLSLETSVKKDDAPNMYEIINDR